MITEKIKQIMQQIKELDPSYEFITEESLETDLKEYLALLKLLPEMKKIAEIDMYSKDNKVQSNLVEIVDN